jgi:hypothetical protein
MMHKGRIMPSDMSVMPLKFQMKQAYIANSRVLVVNNYIPETEEHRLTFISVRAGGPASGNLSHIFSTTTIISDDSGCRLTVLQNCISEKLVPDCGTCWAEGWFSALAVSKTIVIRSCD